VLEDISLFQGTQRFCLHSIGSSSLCCSTYLEQSNVLLLHPYFITYVVSIITHVYSAIGDAKGSINGILGSKSKDSRGHLPDETAIYMMVDMGFPRDVVEEALRSVETNNVEMVMEWLFSHLKSRHKKMMNLPLLPCHWVILRLPKTMPVKKEDRFLCDL
jgi:hypothetical protein